MIRPAKMADAETLCQINRDEMGYDVPIDFAKDALNILALAVRSNQQGKGIGKQSCIGWKKQQSVVFTRFA